jgi:hypothetical protein
MRRADEHEAEALRALQDASRSDVGPEEWDSLIRVALVYATLAAAAATFWAGPT